MNALARHRRREWHVLLTVIALAFTLVLAACSSSASSSSTSTAVASPGQGGGALVVGDPVALSNSDPIHAISSRDQSYLWTVYDTLLTFTAGSTEPAPGLAKSWSYPDPLTLVLKLRSGVTFQDGTPFNAAAVKFNLDRDLGTGTTTVGLLGSVSSVDATNATTVTIHLKQADSSLLLALSDLPGMMVSPTAAKKSANSLSVDPVGAGPYQFVSQVNGSGFVVKRYAGYWNKSYVGPSSIQFKVLPDPATEANALKSGQINFALNVDSSQVASLKAAGGIKVLTSPSLETIMLIEDLKKAPLNNPVVRQAISLAVDRPALVAEAEFGDATPAYAILPKESWAYPTGIATPARDVAKAKSLLAGAGLTKVTFNMIYQPTSAYQRIATLLQAQLAEAGITLNIIPHDLTDGAPEFLSGAQYDSELASFGGRQDPATAYSVLYGSTALLNPGKSVIPGMDALLTKADSTTDVSTRKPVLQQLGQLVASYLPSTILYQRQLVVAYSDTVTGYVPNVLGKPKFGGISVAS
jgi:peptide/nickel transport system permease protein/peptide/nickel transport system substrate-binding protein